MSKNRKQKTAEQTTAVVNMTAEQLAELTREIIAETEQQTAEQTETAETEQTATEQTAETEQTETALQFDIVAETTDRDFTELKAVAKSIHIKNKPFIVAVDSVAELRDSDGEGTDDSVFIGSYGGGSNGKGELLSIWCRRKATNRTATMYQNGKKEKHAFPCDFGLRFSNDTFEMFNSIAESHELISALDFTHAEIKHNERRFSFPTLQSITAFLAVLYNAYETATAEQTTEIAETETETA